VIGIKDVAAQAGVSVGTVSNVLNRPDRVADQTRDRVLAAIDALGFVRNESARQLRAGRSRSIGMVVLDIGNPFFTDMARGAETAAHEADLSVILCNSAEEPAREARHLELLEQQRVQGILITPVGGNEKRLAEIRRRGTPAVLLDQSSRSRLHCSVGVDDVLGGELATAHLLDQGHRSLAFVGGPPSTRQVQDRRKGAMRALAACDIDEGALTVIETAALNVAAGAAAGAAIAERSPSRRPTAAFCANDLLALGLLQEMTRRRVRVPLDLAIVGYDDIDFAAAAAVPLTSVRQPREQLGRTGTQLLVDEVRDGDAHKHRHVVFTPELVVRASSNGRHARRAQRMERPRDTTVAV
jgi:LacI family transcriptional regulator